MIEAATPEGIARAARCLKEGGLVALPTETVYGLAADASQREAVARIYALKGRPADHPLIVHVPDLAAARYWAVFDARAERAAAAFWPGPLTLVLPRAPQAPAWACAGQPTIALRCPSHPVAQRVLAGFIALGGHGVAAPSANRFGRVSPTQARHVIDDLGEDAPLVLEGGAAEVGVESTLLDLSRDAPRLLRPGRIGRAQLASALGESVFEAGQDAPRASGTLAAHYQPRTPVIQVPASALAARIAQAGPARFGVWSSQAPAQPVTVWRSMPAHAAEAEAQLYAVLRELDGLQLDQILVERPPAEPEWEAVADRLNRASHPAPPAG